MKKQTTLKRKTSLTAFCWALMFCVVAFSPVGMAKSLYLAGEGDYPGFVKLWVYDVQPDGNLVFQTTSSFLDGGAMAVNGMGIDPNSNTLFLTFDGFSDAAVVDTESLEFQKFIYLVPWDMHAGSMTYDPARSRVYMTDDGKNRLILYSWVPELPDLHNIGYGATEVPLSKPNAGALVYDPDREKTYVACTDNGIEVLQTAFDREDWVKVDTIGTNYEVQSLGIDSRRQYLYAGGRRTEPGGAAITQHNLATGATVEVMVGDVTETVMSLCVDSASSLVYALIGKVTAPTRTINVYNASFNLIETVTIEGDVRQLHIPSTSIGYNPLNLTITPVSGTAQNVGQHVAGPGSEIRYEVCMTNTNLFPVTDIILTNTLPAELEFIRAEGLDAGLGVYDQLSHTYFYHNPLLNPDGTQCFSVVARIKNDVPFGSVVTNSVSADSNETPQSTASVDVEVGHNTLGLTKTVVMDPNHLQVGNTIYVDAGAYLTYKICLSNLNNSSPVENVLVIDNLPDTVEFVSAEQAGLISHYDASTHSHSWAFNVVEPNFLDCFNITVRIKDDVPPGEMISNEVMLGGSETPTVTDITSIVVKYNALAVNMTVAGSGDYNPVTNQVVRGGILTYLIDVNNLDPVYPAENVIVTDSIPEGLQFISAVGDVNGLYDPLSRTYMLEQPILGPSQGIHMELTFLVADDLPGHTVLTNSAIAMANGAPASSTSFSVSVFAPSAATVPASLDLYYTGPLLQEGGADDIMAVMKLPDHIQIEDIDVTQPLTMTPGPAAAFHKDAVQGIPTIYYMYVGFDGVLNVKGFFNRQAVLNALYQGQESVTITVTGSLKNGQSFEGQKTVPVK